MRSSGRKSNQVESARQGRTFHRSHKAGVWLRQGALSRAEQKPSSPARDLRAGQFADRASPSAVWSGDVECPAQRQHAAQTTESRPTRRAVGTLTLAAKISIAILHAPTPCSDVS